MLSPEEKKRLQQLEGEVGGLSEEEAMRMDQLEAEISQAEAEPSIGDKAQAALSGFGDSATFGYLPEIQAAVEPLTDKLFGAVTGQSVSDDRDYDERLRSSRIDVAETQDAAPGYALAGNVAGFAAPGGLVGKGAKALAKGGGTLAKLAQGATGVGGVAQKAKGLAALGAAEGALYNPSRGEYEGDAGDRLTNALVGAAGGAAFPVAGAAIKKGVDTVAGFAKGTGKALFRSVLGAEQEAINRYLKNPEVMETAKPLDVIKSMVDEVVLPIKEEVVDAREGLKGAQARMKEAQFALSSEFKAQDKEIKAAFKKAEAQLKRDYTQSYDQLNKVRPPSHLTDSIVESISKLKSSVGRGSKEALDILTREVKGDLDISGAASVVDDLMEDLLVKGQVPKQSQAWFRAMEDLRDDIASYEGAMTPYDIKKYIKQLDASIDVDEAAGSFSAPDLKAKIAARKYFDGIIKEASPGYAEVMTAVADDAALLYQARKKLGTADKTMRALNSIDRDINVENRNLLEKLGERTGRDYKSDVAEYLEVKNKLKSLSDPDAKDMFMRDLEGYKDFDEAKALLAERDALTALDKQKEMQRALAESQAAEEFKAAQERLMRAKESETMVRTFSEQNSESKIKKLVNVLNAGKKGEGITIKQEFQKLSEISDKDFTTMVEELATASAFDKTFIRGSRNVNLFSVIGMAMGGGTAGFMWGGPVGAAAGAVMGAMNDMYGPKVAKKMLDQVTRLKGIPTRSKIMSLDLPPDAKKDLIFQFENFAMMNLVGQPVEIDAEDIPMVREDLKRNSEMNEAAKAKAIMQLNKHGRIDNIRDVIGDPPEELTAEDYIISKRVQ